MPWHMGEDAKEEIDYRELLSKYINYIAEHSHGITHLNPDDRENSGFTDREWQVLRDLW